MGDVKLFEAEDLQAPAREFVHRGGAHTADAHHYDVVSVCGRHFVLVPV